MPLFPYNAAVNYYVNDDDTPPSFRSYKGHFMIDLAS